MSQNTKSPNPEISIIVPVYNVETYLPQCLESIKNQTFSHWECIIVDDGTKDKSGMIAENFANTDSRFRVIHKSNGGLSSARNAALPMVAGKYVVFIDSDDWVEPHYLHTLLDLASKYDADVVQTGFFKDFRGFSRKKPLTNSEKILEGEELYQELLKNSMLPSFMWNKLLKKEVITSGFPEGKNYEDFLTLNQWLPNISKIVVAPPITYHYRMRKGSITSVNSAKSLENLFEGYNARLAEIERLAPHMLNENQRLRYLYRNYVDVAKKIARNEKDETIRRASIEKIRKHLFELKEVSTEELGVKLWKRARLLKKDPESFIKKMRLARSLDIHTLICNSRLYR